ncbi:hypothetical protein ONZ45_g4072 [Pleurotus djamor]|nr:hypothetical protein ONZ45_g4072 [Pleurotus djamor]
MMRFQSLKHLLTVLSIVSSVVGITPRALEKRQFQTDAVCDTSFGWASNSRQQTPCIVAAYVNGACGTNTYRVTKLLDGNRYNAPNATTANPCSCLSGHGTVDTDLGRLDIPMFGFPQQQVSHKFPTAADIPAYRFYWGSYFPPGITLASGTSIPYYAGTNPENWPNHQFDPVQARAIATENNNDLTPNEEREDSSGTPIGPIVGGVVGGVVVVILAIIATAFVIHRRKKRGNHASQAYDPTPTPFDMSNMHQPAPAPTLHLRSLSDMSQKSLTTTAYLASTTPTSPTAPSVIMTHISAPSVTHYANSESHFSEFGMNHPPSVYSSPSPPPLPNSSVMSRENIIEPFRLAASVNSHARTERSEKSGLDGYPVYDSPSSPPGIPPIEHMSDPSTPQRRRVNPPAYSPPVPSSSPQMLSHTPSIAGQSSPSEGPSSWTSPSAAFMDGKGRRIREKYAPTQRRDYDPSITSPSPTVVTGSAGFADDQSPDVSVIHDTLGSQFGDRDGNATMVGGQTIATGNSDVFNRLSAPAPDRRLP